MPRSRGRAAALAVALAGCGPAHVFHKDPEPACEGALALAAREDVARLAGCTHAGSIQIRPAGPLDLGSLGRLERIDGDLQVGPTVGFARLPLPRLREVRGTLRIAGNGDLEAVALPALERAGVIEIDGNLAIRTVVLPNLRSVDALAITGNPELGLIDVAKLGAVEVLRIADNPRLVLVEGPAVSAGTARIEGNAMLPADQVERLRARP